MPQSWFEFTIFARLWLPRERDAKKRKEEPQAYSVVDRSRMDAVLKFKELNPKMFVERCEKGGRVPRPS